MENSTPTRLARWLDETVAVIQATRESLLPAIEEAAALVTASLREGGTVAFFGNGGSAADSQHLAAELVGRFGGDGEPLRALALTTDTSVLTALGNDAGQEVVFERQVRALLRPGDVAIGLSTSGGSANVVAGLRAARALGARTIALTGETGGAVADEAELALRAPSADTGRIQEAHIVIGHAICRLAHEAFSP